MLNDDSCPFPRLKTTIVSMQCPICGYQPNYTINFTEGMRATIVFHDACEHIRNMKIGDTMEASMSITLPESAIK